MRRVLCVILLLGFGIAPLMAAKPPSHRAQISKRQLRNRYKVKAFNKHKKPPQARWVAKKR